MFRSPAPLERDREGAVRNAIAIRCEDFDAYEVFLAPLNLTSIHPVANPIARTANTGTKARTAYSRAIVLREIRCSKCSSAPSGKQSRGLPSVGLFCRALKQAFASAEKFRGTITVL